MRYVDIDRQLESRTHSTQKAMEGIRRFLYGLGKKVLIANVLGQCVDSIYAMELSEVTGAFAWLAAGMYMLQIYYDFSGYSDMAIGLGKLFGFDFPENFNYPYLSKSVQEFWRRWHISLGTWFREYLYFPLGGSRKGAVRTYVNLMIVFLVTGLWHGAGMTFVLWGVYYGVLQVIERLGFKKILGKYPVIGWSYTFLAALFGWVLFRADTFVQAGGMMVRMICPWKYLQTDVLLQNIVDHRAFVMLIVGLLGCGFIQKIWQRIPGTKRWKYSIGEAVWCAILLFFGHIEGGAGTISTIEGSATHNWIVEHYTLLTIVTVPFMVLAVKIAFRKAGAARYNWVEYLLGCCYLSVLYILLSLVLMPIGWVLDASYYTVYGLSLIHISEPTRPY